jgi:DNA-binding transcriptional MerR regulator
MALYTIGKVARRVGLSGQMIHVYHSLGLIREVKKSPAGYRLFDESVFRRIELIRRLNRSGYSLRDIKEVFFQRNPQTAESGVRKGLKFQPNLADKEG